MLPEKQQLMRRILEASRGALIFFLVVAGATYYLQSSLILFKKYGAYTHWATLLVAIPIIAGLLLRLVHVCYPLICTIIGALASAALLYPQYKTFWAVPPTLTHVAIYTVIVLGFGFIATQPLRTTVMMAFRLGRFAAPVFSNLTEADKGRKPAAKTRTPTKTASASRSTPTKKPSRKPATTTTGQLQLGERGSFIALLELAVGVTSLVLSIFSIFFLGQS